MMKLDMPMFVPTVKPTVLECPVCGDPIDHGHKFPYIMMLSSARIAHVDVRYCCSAGCREQYAMSDGMGHPLPANVKAPEIYLRGDGPEIRLPAVYDRCPHCCHPESLADCCDVGDDTVEYAHCRESCKCTECNGDGEIPHTPFFIHSDDPNHAHLVDGEITLYICEVDHSKGEHFDGHVEAHHKARIANLDHLVEQWRFPHAAALNKWSTTPIDLRTHLKTRATFRHIRAGVPAEEAEELGIMEAEIEHTRRLTKQLKR